MPIDTHQLARNLGAAGFDAEKTDVIVAAFAQRGGDLVTKDYLRAEVSEIRGELGALKASIIARTATPSAAPAAVTNQ